MEWFTKKPVEKQYTEAQVNKLVDTMMDQVHAASAQSNQGMRQRIQGIISGGYDFADSLHNVYLDYGYPASLDFHNYYNMYRRFGIAYNVVELFPYTGWSTPPVINGSAQFDKELELLTDKVSLFTRLKGLDTRQRVGRYGGMFMRVKDGKRPEEPIDSQLSGVNSLVEMMPLYESQLDVVDTIKDPSSEDFGQPAMYEFRGGVSGNRNEDMTDTFNIHPDRIVIAAEGSDNGSVYGISSLEPIYNSLMDLRKIAGAGGEGFYKNAAQSIVFNIKDGASAKANEDILEAFNENMDDFMMNRSRRSMWTPGMDSNVLESNLTNPKEFFMNSLNDVAAGSKYPATILIGQQTGRLASDEDSRHYLSTAQSRRLNFQTDMTSDVLDWCIEFGVLPASDYEVEWDDLLARSQEEKLGNADLMAGINQKQFHSGGSEVFTEEEIRLAAGAPEEVEEELADETIEDDEDE